MEADFQGWATKPDLKCSDGRTIAHDAFSRQDGAQVPLVWQHNHNDPENVLGHVKLESRDGGLYAHGFLNDTPKAKHARALLEHKDINQLSIWANDLIERSGMVLHGKVREVSLVLSGANPGATITHVVLKHDDGDEFELEDQAIISSGYETGELSLTHSSDSDESDEDDELLHADGDPTLEEVLANDERTIEEIFDSMDVSQQAATSYLVSQALAQKGDLQQSDLDDETEDENEESSESDDSDDSDDSDNSDDTNSDTAQNDSLGHSGEKGDKIMGAESRNVFDRTEQQDGPKRPVLSHGDVKTIFETAKTNGSLMDAMTGYALEHGITNVEALFPDAEALNGGVPEWVKRDDGWVQPFLAACTKSPFGRIKTRSADITFEAARAKGYVKGELKKEEFFDIKDRTTTPATIYKKQALDRDDIIDITDFDVVAWMRNEMRMMLDEEIARSILVGDGRAVDHPDKIKTAHIRPIATDDDLYATQVNVNISDASSSFQEFIDACHRNRRFYRGTGNPNFYTTVLWIARAMTL
jgi:HK97 family phage prohead protease